MHESVTVGGEMRITVVPSHDGRVTALAFDGPREIEVVRDGATSKQRRPGMPPPRKFARVHPSDDPFLPQTDPA